LNNQVQKELKIVFFTNWYPNKKNPVEGIFVQEIIKAVSKSHSVLVIHNVGVDPTLDRPWKLELQENSPLTRGIKTYRFRFRPSPIPKTSLLISIWYFLQAFRKVVQIDGRPDILHAQVYPAGFLAAIVGKLSRIPVIITEHSSAFARDLLSRSNLFTVRIAYRLAKVVLPVSSALQDAIIQKGLQGNFQIIPNVVDDSVFYYLVKKKTDNILRFLYVGLLDRSENKGLKILFQALEKLAETDQNWQLDIVGDGPGREYYQRMVAESPIKKCVYFHGLQTKPEIAGFFGKADLFVLPSIKETFSVVTAEALATGTPVLATKCGGPEDFINENNGILVEAGDAQALYEGLLKITKALDGFDHSLIAEEAYQRFSPEVIRDELTKIYDGVLN